MNTPAGGNSTTGGLTGSGGQVSAGGQTSSAGGVGGSANSGGSTSPGAGGIGSGGITATAGGGAPSGGTGGGGAANVGGGSTGGVDGSGGSDGRDVHFRDWPSGADPAAVGKKLAEVFKGSSTPSGEDEKKHYKLACAWYGSLAVSALLNDSALTGSLITRYSSYKDTWTSLLSSQGHVDDNVFGIVPLEIALHDTDPLYATEGLKIADHQRTNINTQKRFAIDDMFMITGLQVQAFRVSDDLKYLDLASSVMIEYLDRLQQSDGLFFHHEDFHHKWGRGNGWFAAGMAELIRELPPSHANAGAIRAGYEKMMAGLLDYQIKDGSGAGLWPQIVDSDDSRNWPETSGSAMFTYALISGVRAGWLDPDTYGPAARAGWLALVAKINAQGLVQDISDWAYKPSSHEGGPTYAGDEENYYFERPKLTGDNHGQAPVLWSAAELLRPLEN